MCALSISEVHRTNPNCLLNPNFCVGCFGLIISKNFVTASKIGGNYFIFAAEFSFAKLFLAHKRKKIAVFFCILRIGAYAFCCHCKNQVYLGLWDCIPFLHRHTNVDQLDSGIAVHGTDKHSLLPLPAVCNSRAPHGAGELGLGKSEPELAPYLLWGTTNTDPQTKPR